MIGLAALILAALFAGAALYISLVEVPARRLLAPAAARTQWAEAYRRGYVVQAGLALLSGVCGLVVWWRWGLSPQLLGGLLMLANWPWTLIAIMPVNRRLLATSEDDPIVPQLLSRWAKLHGIRTLLGFAAAFCFALPYITR